jgi:carbon monoxide dehydrogenase subunit G
MSCPKVVSYDCVYDNALVVHQVHSKEVDELLEQMADELVLELKAKMPSVPRNKIVAR